MSEPVILVTGGDENYFMSILGLVEGVQFYTDLPIMVCDFGLSEGQIKFLDELGLLLPRPEEIPAGIHPWYYKSSIGHYLQDHDYEHIVWVDADMSPTTDFSRPLHQLLNQHGNKPWLGCCYNYYPQTIQANINLLSTKHDVEVFRNLVAQEPGLEKNKYLNSGFFITNDRDFLAQWEHITRNIAVHTLFEQNCFNYLAYKHFNQVTVLDDVLWNLHASHVIQLIEVNVQTEKPVFMINGKRTYLIHPTGLQSEYVKALDPCEIGYEDYILTGHIKLVNSQSISIYQLKLLHRALKRHFKKLKRYGILKARQESSG